MADGIVWKVYLLSVELKQFLILHFIIITLIISLIYNNLIGENNSQHVNLGRHIYFRVYQKELSEDLMVPRSVVKMCD